MNKKNMISLKELQAELEALKKASKARKISSDVTDSKQNIVHTIISKASSPFLLIISTLLAYGHKIPIISKAI